MRQDHALCGFVWLAVSASEIVVIVVMKRRLSKPFLFGGLPLRLGLGAVALHDTVELAAVEPYAAASVAVIDLDAVAIGQRQPGLAIRTGSGGDGLVRAHR